MTIEGSAAQPNPRWAGPALGALLVATAGFWCVGLSRNGWANAFYSAAVQAGTKSWTAFLYGSSDAANSITVDKPPASLWPMEISARLFGVNTWSIQLPQVLLGVASVALLYVIVSKSFGAPAGLIAGAILAVTPVATLMFRYNNPDALLTFLMIAAAWALLRAVADGRTRWLLLCGALVGLGFLAKQLQVMLVVPALGLTYLLSAPVTPWRRTAQLFAALAAMVVAGGWWVLVVTLVPADARPYIGGSTDNSFLNLTFGYNGLARLTGGEPVGTGGSAGPPPGMGGGPFGSQSGVTRLFTGAAGGQISWFLPAALVLLAAGVLLGGRSPREGGARAQYLVWGGWLLSTAIVFSFMSGTFHEYYTVALAPAVAAVVGCGVAELWAHRDRRWVALTLAISIAVTAAWSWVLLGRTPTFLPQLRWVVLGLGVGAAVALFITSRPAHRRAGSQAWAAIVAAAAVISGPLAYCVDTVATPHTGGIVNAGPSITNVSRTPPGSEHGGGGGLQVVAVTDRVVAALSSNRGEYTWVAAVSGSTAAASYQLATDDPVMAIGGFAGSDPSPTLAQFQHDVAGHQIHFYVVSDTRGPGADDATTEAAKIGAWAKSHFVAETLDGVTLYDLTPPNR